MRDTPFSEVSIAEAAAMAAIKQQQFSFAQSERCN